MNTKFLILFLLCVSCSGWIIYAIPSVDAHDIQSYPATRFVNIENETFDKQHMQTGETLTVRGSIVSNVDKDLRGWLSIFSESTNVDNRWEMLARDPPGIVFDVSGNSVTDYLISAKALEPGTYHIHTQFNIDKIGSELGPGQTVIVQGDPITKPIPFTNIAYQLTPIVIGIMIVIAVYYFWRKRK